MKRILSLALLPLLVTSCDLKVQTETKMEPQVSVTSAAVSGKKLIGARLQVKAEKVDEFIAAAKPCIAASRAEPGCISYTLLQDPSDKTAFLFFEEWKNQQAIDEHFGTPHFKAFGAQLKDFLNGKPVITVYDCSGEKKVE
ncbi:MAG: putative quinol monooxygenase [Kiritimatiellaeota bacterium]|nr:putative quinol monooxygenase [Kiritimatiellota bacterium]